mmetsp:Transcript_3992/g.11559  ORF Transcript_3992/g.11559 Transcript_3992/m.11559 type:complete len:90 (+) Transcript_3992:264-533(+)
MELLGPLPRGLVRRGRLSEKLLDRDGSLKRIKGLKPWALRDVLVQKYQMPLEGPDGADALASFLLPMLRYEPERRASAAQMLQHPWLQS